MVNLKKSRSKKDAIMYDFMLLLTNTRFNVSTIVLKRVPDKLTNVYDIMNVTKMVFVATELDTNREKCENQAIQKKRVACS